MAETVAELAARVRLVETCPACPEQYDAFLDDELVGYLRLRWGRFSVCCPDVAGDEVMCAEWSPTPYKGRFADDHERQSWLRSARLVIAAWLLKRLET